MKGRKVVVVGGGVAGVSAALAASRRGAETTIIEASRAVGLSRAHLPLLLTHGWREEDAYIPEASSLKAEGVRLRTETKAVSVRHAERELVLEPQGGAGNQALGFDSLVVCAGAAREAPEMRGSAKPNVFLLDGPSDYLRLRDSLDSMKSLAVTGPVPLALKVGELLSARADEVRIFCGEGGLDGQFLGPVAEMIRAAASRRQKETKASRVSLVDGRVESILGLGKAEAVVSAGSVTNCDGVVIIPRSVPSVPIVECERGPQGGILVDTAMSTSLDNVFAAGDSTEIRHKSGSVAARLYSTSRMSGDVAGTNAAGGNARASPSWAVEQEYFGVELCSAGLREDEALAMGLKASSEAGIFRAQGPSSSSKEILVSLVYDVETHEVYGMQLSGWRASAYSNEASLIVSLGLTVEQLTNMESPYLPGSSYESSPIGLTARRITSEGA